ncbi:MAG: T9SS type A sorting domain-containing protein [Bacteroidota bacterium]|nr:T9SS type A sorting domain-containing protein [Bacteroidota bacterium]
MKLNLFLLTIIISFSLSNKTFSQRILFQSDFENLNLTSPDSLPQGWKKLDADSNFFGRGKGWAVRDTTQILGGDTVVNKPRAHSGKKSLHISWFSGKGGSYEGDDWVWTDSLRIIQGDSLIFWALLGNTQGIFYYVDSVQIWLCSAQTPVAAHTRLVTLKSNLDTNFNIWTEHKFSLSQLAGQRTYIAFRYYLPVQNALWCNIDDMFIGNRSSTIGITQLQSGIPEKFSLSQNYPNPFNPATKIKFDIPKDLSGRMQNVEIEIYDVIGKKVATLVNEKLSAGVYSVSWTAGNFSSGVYYYTLITNDFIQTKKMTLLK